MKAIIVILFLCLFILNSALGAEEFEVSSGTLLTKEFNSDYVAQRRVWFWFPKGYDINKNPALLFMHDGQMLFDEKDTWNGQEWQLDEVAQELLDQRRIRDFMVVGIMNAGAGAIRGAEYFPHKAVDYLKDDSIRKQHPYVNRELEADNYLKFIVNEIKPFLRAEFGLRTEGSNSFLMGSSMGGLISIYALSEYPDEFVAAACLSTHWPGSLPVEDTHDLSQAIFSYLKAYLPEAGRHRLYFDFGTETLDQYYPPLQAQADAIIKTKGYSEKDWQTLRFEGADHSEAAWAERLHIPLLFLLANDKAP